MFLYPKVLPLQCALWPTSLPFAQRLVLPWGNLELFCLAANTFSVSFETTEIYMQISGFLLARHSVRHLEIPLRTKRFLHTPS